MEQTQLSLGPKEEPASRRGSERNRKCACAQATHKKHSGTCTHYLYLPKRADGQTGKARGGPTGDQREESTHAAERLSAKHTHTRLSS